MESRNSKINGEIMAAVVISRTTGAGSPLQPGDTLHDVDIRIGDEGHDSWTRFRELEVEEKHVRAAENLLRRFPLGYADPRITLGDTMRDFSYWLQ